jgi:hypothetical protein
VIRPALLTLLVLVLASLACMKPIATPTLPASPTAAPSATAPARRTPSPAPPAQGTPTTAQVMAASVNVHKAADVDSEVIGWVYAGQDVVIVACDGNFCRIEQPFGYVFRGCLSDNPDGLGCEAR